MCSRRLCSFEKDVQVQSEVFLTGILDIYVVKTWKYVIKYNNVCYYTDSIYKKK